MHRFQELASATQTTSGTGDDEEALRLVLERATALTGADAGVLLLRHGEDETTTVAAVGASAVPAEQTARPVDRIGEEELRPLLGVGAEAAVMALPLTLWGRRHEGTLALGRTRPLRFGTREQILAAAFAKHAALTLESMQLNDAATPSPSAETAAGQVLDAIAAAVVVMGSDFVFRDLNSAAVGVLGMRAEALIGTRAEDFFLAWPELAPLLGDGAVAVGGFERFLPLPADRSGEHWTAHLGRTEQPDRIVLTLWPEPVRECTSDRRHAYQSELQDALHRTRDALAQAQGERRKLATVMEATPSGIILVEAPEMHSTYANRPAKAICGGADQGAAITDLAGLFRHPDGTPYRADELPCVRALVTGEEVRDEEMGFRPREGEQRVLEVNAVPIHLNHSDKNYVVVGLRDITEQKLAEHRLTESRRKLAKRTQHLRRVNEELQQFAYVVSHDLKAPLRAVANLVTWLEEDIGDTLAVENRRQMDLLRQRVTRMDGLINALLDYSRIGHRQGRTEPVEARGLVREIVNSLSLPKAFRIEVAEDLPTLETDRLQLSQVFANLVSNAVKHHDRSDGRVWISSRDAGNFFEFRVADDGPGIPASQQERIFEMFQSLSATPDEKNTGIGLALIKKIVEGQGGQVRVNSEEGQGATFRFTWPKVPARDDA